MTIIRLCKYFRLEMLFFNFHTTSRVQCGGSISTSSPSNVSSDIIFVATSSHYSDNKISSYLWSWRTTESKPQTLICSNVIRVRASSTGSIWLSNHETLCSVFRKHTLNLKIILNYYLSRILFFSFPHSSKSRLSPVKNFKFFASRIFFLFAVYFFNFFFCSCRLKIIPSSIHTQKLHRLFSRVHTSSRTIEKKIDEVKVIMFIH